MKYLVLSVLTAISLQVKATQAQNVEADVLIGQWLLDMTPENKTDDNFASMRIDNVEGNSLKGMFYREGVKIRNGSLNIQSDKIYAALISGDNSGEYNSSFYYKGGKLYGTTHAINRGFLSVWTATKVKE